MLSINARVISKLRRRTLEKKRVSSNDSQGFSVWEETVDEFGEEKIGRSIIFCRSWHAIFSMKILADFEGDRITSKAAASYRIWISPIASYGT